MPRSTRRAARLERSASRLRRLADKIRPAGEAAAAPMRRLLNGQTVPATETGRTWQDLVHAAAKPTGGAALNPDHPSRKHDGPLIARPYLIEHPAGARTRAERRAAAVTAARDARKQRRAQVATEFRLPADLAAPSRSVRRRVDQLEVVVAFSDLHSEERAKAKAELARLDAEHGNALRRVIEEARDRQARRTARVLFDETAGFR